VGQRKVIECNYWLNNTPACLPASLSFSLCLLYLPLSLCLSLYLSLSLSGCLSVWLSLCLSLSVCLSVCVSLCKSWKNILTNDRVIGNWCSLLNLSACCNTGYSWAQAMYILHLLICAYLRFSNATYSISIKREKCFKCHIRKCSTYFCTLWIGLEFYGFEIIKQKGANAAQILIWNVSVIWTSV